MSVMLNLLFLLFSQAASLDPEVEKVLEKSRTTTATYSLYSRVEISPRDGTPSETFSAEFHRGTRHRVETAVARLVADCATMQGTALFLDTGEIDKGDWVAKAACGVNAAKPIISSKWLGAVETPFGPATRISVTDSDNVRAYDVSPEGILIASTYETHDGKPEVVAHPMAIERQLPEDDIFTESSLHRIVTPSRFRVKAVAK